MWTIISGIFGGILRLAPELFKYLDARNERKHELDLQDKALKFQEVAGKQRLDEVRAAGDVAWDSKALDALQLAIKDQGTPSGIPWIDGFSKFIRPVITLQWVVLLYPGVIITTFIILLINNVPVIDALNKVFGPEEKAVCSFILDFWFVGRVLEKNRK